MGVLGCFLSGFNPAGSWCSYLTASRLLRLQFNSFSSILGAASLQAFIVIKLRRLVGEVIIAGIMITEFVVTGAVLGGIELRHGCREVESSGGWLIYIPGTTRTSGGRREVCRIDASKWTTVGRLSRHRTEINDSTSDSAVKPISGRDP